MLLTGLQMRTVSTPVINKALSKPRLHQGKTTQHKNTGLLGLSLYVGHVDKQKAHGLETVNESKKYDCGVKKTMLLLQNILINNPLVTE